MGKRYISSLKFNLNILFNIIICSCMYKGSTSLEFLIANIVSFTLGPLYLSMLFIMSTSLLDLSSIFKFNPSNFSFLKGLFLVTLYKKSYYNIFFLIRKISSRYFQLSL